MEQKCHHDRRMPLFAAEELCCGAQAFRLARPVWPITPAVYLLRLSLPDFALPAMPEPWGWTRTAASLLVYSRITSAEREGIGN